MHLKLFVTLISLAKDMDIASLFTVIRHSVAQTFF